MIITQGPRSSSPGLLGYGWSWEWEYSQVDVRVRGPLLRMLTLSLWKFFSGSVAVSDFPPNPLPLLFLERIMKQNTEYFFFSYSGHKGLAI